MNVSTDAPDAAASTWPERFVQLKREIAQGREEELMRSWKTVIAALKARTDDFIKIGPAYIPQVDYSEMQRLNAEQLSEIKKKGCAVIKNVVPDEEALRWKADLEKIIEDNPLLEGIPFDDKQFFFLYWSKPQVEARAHPNVLNASTWMNQLYAGTGVDPRVLSTPLTYADRFRIRKPGPTKWEFHPPHVDSGSVERWETPGFRSIYHDIFAGNWEKHDAYDIDARIVAQSGLYDRSNQASVFRTFQGWLAMSETGPGEGTLRVYPDVQLGNAYIILRPFFSPIDPNGDLNDPENWKLDVSKPEFPGIALQPDGTFRVPHFTDVSHPHLRTDDAMVSVPHVSPGDMVFWHSDLIHSVEESHNGKNDSSVLYIASVPATKQNVMYVVKQREAFLKGRTPPDAGRDSDESGFVGVGCADDIRGPLARRAMGLDGFEEMAHMNAVGA